MAAAFGLVLLLGFVIDYFWWILGAIAVTAALYGLAQWLQRLERERDEAQQLARQREKDLRIRADRQLRWELIGDDRGVYGADGAAPMRRVTADSRLEGGDDGPIATLARTPEEIVALRTEKTREWHWALFASILVQRRQSVASRLRDSALGYVPPDAIRVRNGDLLVDRLYSVVDRMLETLRQIDAFLSAPEFMGAFGDTTTDADADAVEHVANRLMDYHLRLLELSEECRSLSTLSAYSDAVRDCARLVHQPLDGFKAFINEFVALVEAFPRILEHATGNVDLGGIALELDVDYQLLSRLTDRMLEISPR